MPRISTQRPAARPHFSRTIFHIRHKILLTLPLSAPILFVEQGFAGCCESAGTAGQRVSRGTFCPGAGLHASAAYRQARPFALHYADRPLDSRAAACPTPRNVKRRLEWPRCRQTKRNSPRPQRTFRTPRSKRRIHGMTATPHSHSCGANPRANARNSSVAPAFGDSRAAWPECLHQRFA